MDKMHFKTMLNIYCIQDGVAYVAIHSDPKRLIVVCGSKDCDWRINVSRLLGGMT